MPDRTIIECDADEITACAEWHGGQSSMLYAVASTSALSLGTVRPRERSDAYPSDPYACHYRDLTDLEWERYLVEKLYDEASKALDNALSALGISDDGDYDAYDATDGLQSLVAKCEAWLAEHPEES